MDGWMEDARPVRKQGQQEMHDQECMAGQGRHEGRKEGGREGRKGR